MLRTKTTKLTKNFLHSDKKKKKKKAFLQSSEILMGAMSRFSCTAVVLANTWRNEMRKVYTAGDD